MNSKSLLGVAMVLLVAAGATAYWGVQLSKGPDDTALSNHSAVQVPIVETSDKPLNDVVQDVASPRASVIVLARDVSSGSPLSSEDLVEEKMRIAPPGSYADLQLLVGKYLWRDLPAGTVLSDSSFSAGGPLARMIRESERAVTIRADEVVSSGGHLFPGDYVDVLLYLKQGERNSDRTMQVVVPALRVLSVGDALGLTVSGDTVIPAASDEDEEKSANHRNAKARTIALAVPDALLTRFSLAAEVGSLRLAVRSAEEGLLASFYEGEAKPVFDSVNQQLFQFEKFALRQAKRPQEGLVPLRPKGIEVFRGSVVSRENP